MKEYKDIIYDLNEDFFNSLVNDGLFAKKLKETHELKSWCATKTEKRIYASKIKLLNSEWRDYLKTKITKAAIQNNECSRSSIQNLQRDLFGFSQSTKKISIYLKNNKNPKKIEIDIDQEFKLRLIQTYIRFEKSLISQNNKTVVQNDIDNFRLLLNN